MPNIKESLNRYVQESNKGTYKTWDDLYKSFPEFSTVPIDKMTDFVLASNKGLVKNDQDILRFVPELGDQLKKKEPSASVSPSTSGGVPSTSDGSQSGEIDYSALRKEEDFIAPSDNTGINTKPVMTGGQMNYENQILKERRDKKLKEGLETHEKTRIDLAARQREEADEKEYLRTIEEGRRAGLVRLPGFSKDIESLSPSLFFKEEEDVRPVLQEKYGKYGFVFEETGMGTDKIRVTRADGSASIEIDTDNFSESDNNEMYAKLSQFIKENALPPTETVSKEFAEKADLARSIRPVSRENEDGTKSTVKFTSFEADGKHFVIPTIFPKDPATATSKPDDWVEPATIGEAIRIASERGEVFEFSDKKEAEEFAEGGWKDISTIDLEANDFFKDRGMDYFPIRRAKKEYDKYHDMIQVIESASDEPDPEAMDRFPHLFVNGELRWDSKKVLSELKDKRDALFGAVRDGGVLRAYEEFDQYLGVRSREKLRDAVAINDVAKQKEQALEEDARRLFGVGVNEIDDLNITDPSKKQMALMLKEKKAVLDYTKKNAALQYEGAISYFNAKENKEVSDEFVEGLSAIASSINNGWQRGMMAQKIALAELGMYDVDDKADRDELVKMISDRMSKMDPRTNRYLARFASASGFKESADVLFSSKGPEIVASWVGESLSQLLPIGSVILPTTTAAGAGAGFLSGGLPGAVSGAIVGLNTGGAITSFALEYTNSILDQASLDGYNVLDPESLELALKDPNVWIEGRKRGIARGIPIALADYVSGNIAGKMIKVGKTASRPAQIGMGVVERGIVDPGMEALGELGAQVSEGLIIDKNIDIRWKEVVAEAGGAFGSKAPNMALSVYRNALVDSNKDLAEKMASPVLAATEETLSTEKGQKRAVEWVTNLQKIGRVSEETAKQVKENIGFRRDVDSILSTGKKIEEDQATPVKKRLMVLMAAKASIESSPARRSTYRALLERVNDEITYTAENKTLASKEKAADLSPIMDEKQVNQPVYSINGKTYSRTAFERKTRRMSDKQLKKNSITVTGDQEVLSMIATRLQIDPEEFSPTRVKEAQRTATTYASFASEDFRSELTEIDAAIAKAQEESQGEELSAVETLEEVSGRKPKEERILNDLIEKRALLVNDPVTFFQNKAEELQKEGFKAEAVKFFDLANTLKETSLEQASKILASKKKRRSEISPEIFENVKKAVAKAFPGMNISRYNSYSDMINDLSGRLPAERLESLAPGVAGATIFDKDGLATEIAIDDSMANETTLPHEVWHAMLLKAFGDDQALFAEFVEGIDKVLRSSGYENIADDLQAFTDQEAYEDVKAEEYLAELGGMLVAAIVDPAKLSKKEKSLLQKIKDFINKILGKVTNAPVFLEDATSENILDFMIEISSKLREGTDVSGAFREDNQEIEGGISAWHGTPHYFDKFTTEKIGSGEGAQAFGWGIYFTSKKEIGKWYAEGLSKAKRRIAVTKNGKKIKQERTIIDKLVDYLSARWASLNRNNFVFELDAFSNFAEIINTGKSKEEAISILRNTLKTAKEDGYKEAFVGLNVVVTKKRIELFERDLEFIENNLSELDAQIKTGGVLYNVILHQGKPVDQYDWANWYERIPDGQMEKILNSTQDEELKKVILENKNRDFSSVYKGVSEKLGDDKAASLFFLKAGIDGIKYPAGTIQMGGVATESNDQNYVVFDEGAVTVIEKTRLQKQDSTFKTDATRSKNRASNVIREQRRRIDTTNIVGYDALIQDAKDMMTAATQRGVSKKDALNDIMDHVTNSKPYEAADDSQKEQIVRDVRKALGKREKSSPSVATVLGQVRDPKKISMTERQWLKQSLAAMAKTAKDTKAAWMKISTELNKSMKDMVVKGSITTPQMMAIIRRYSKINMFDQESIDSFVDFMTRVFKDVEFANKISRAYKLLPKAKKNILSKLGVAQDLVPQLKQMLAVAPVRIPEAVFEVYAQLMEVLGERAAVLTLPEINTMRQDVYNILSAIKFEVDAATHLREAFRDYPDKVVDPDTGLIDFAKTVAQMLKEDVISDYQAEVMRKYKSTVFPKEEVAELTEEEQEEADQVAEEERVQLAQGLKGSLVMSNHLTSRYERGLAARLRNLVASDVVLEMSTDDLTTLALVIQNINNGFVPHSAQLMVEKMNAKINAKSLIGSVERAKLLPFTKYYTRMKGLITGKSDIYEMIRRNPLSAIDQIFGNFRTQDIFDAILRGPATASAAFKAELNQVYEKLDKAEHMLARSFGLDANETLKAKFKIMAYLIELEHQSNTGNVKTNSAIDYINKTIEHIDSGKSVYGDREIKMLEDIRKMMGTDEVVDLQAMFDSFTHAERQATKAIREVNDALADKVAYTSSVIRGKISRVIKNYIHLNVLHDQQQRDVESGTSFAENLNESMRPSTKAKSLIERSGKVSPLNFDAFSSARRGSKFLLMDFHLTEAIRTSRKTVTEAGKTILKTGTKEQKKIFNAINSAFEEATDNLLVNNFTTDTMLDQAMDELARNGYRAVLASSTRFVGELLSNISYAMIAAPLELALGSKMTSLILSPDGFNVMKNLSSTQTNRIYSSETLTGRLVDTQTLSSAGGIRNSKAKGAIHNIAVKLNNRTLKKYRNAVGVTADSIISTPDKLIMRPLWFGSFAIEFQKLTGEKPNMEKIASNDEAYMNEFSFALETATREADKKSVMAGATDNQYMGLLKGASRPDQKPALKFFNMFNNFMTRFLIYEYVTARTGIMAAMGNGSITRKQGMALLAAVTTRMTVYSALTSTLSSAMLSLFTGHDDDDESMWYKFGRALASTFTSMAIGRDFGNATKILLNYGIEEVNESHLDFLRDGEYDPYKNSLVYSPIPQEGGDAMRLLSNLSGPFSPSVKTLAMAYRNFSSKPKKTPDAIQRSEDERYVRLPLEVLGNLGYIPLYKDVRKISNAAIYESLNKGPKAKTGGNTDAQEREYMKKYMPQMYEQMYGKGSPMYQFEQQMKDLNKEMNVYQKQLDDQVKEMEKQMYGGQ